MIKKLIEKIKEQLGIASEDADTKQNGNSGFRLYERDEIFSDYDETENAPKAIVSLIVLLFVIPVVCMLLCFATLLCFFKLMLTPRFFYFSFLL